MGETKVQAKRSEAVWNAFTLAPLRRRLAATLAVDQEEQLDEREHEKEDDEEDMQEEDTGWTKLDWVILAVKVLVYASLQALFIKLEFGAVFFLASGVLFMWQSLENRKR